MTSVTGTPDARLTGSLLDALVLLRACESGNQPVAEAMLASYTGPENADDRGSLVAALISHGVALARLAAGAVGTEPGEIWRMVAATLAAE